jgi:hypothetical protein
VPTLIQLNEATVELRRVPVYLEDLNGDGQASTAGLTAVYRDPQTGSDGAVALVADGGDGRYYVQLSAGQVDTAGLGWIKVSGATIITYVDAVVVLPLHTTLDATNLALIAAANWDLADMASHRVAGSFGELMQLAIGLMNGNSKIDNIVYGAQNVMTSARRRVFASKVALDAAVDGHANDADGEIFRFTITAVDAGSGQITSYKETRTK